MVFHHIQWDRCLHPIIQKTQVGSPAVLLRLARCVARLGLNDGAKLWISVKLFSKQTSSYRTSYYKGLDIPLSDENS